MKQNFEMALLRQEIDLIDKDIVHLLGRRFRTVDRVIATKQRIGLPALIQSRVEDVIARAKASAGVSGVPIETAEKLWRLLVEETIQYEANHGIEFR
jgi:isochorismate pyruvate lyase